MTKLTICSIPKLVKIKKGFKTSPKRTERVLQDSIIRITRLGLINIKKAIKFNISIIYEQVGHLILHIDTFCLNE